MRQNGFSPILVVIIATLLFGLGILFYKNSNLFLPVSRSSNTNKVESLSDVSAIEQQIKSIPPDKLNQIDCATLGFSGGTDSQVYYKEGGHYVVYGKTQTSLSAEDSVNLDKALLTVIPEHPPKYNPDMQMCLSDLDNVLLVERGGKNDPNDLFILRLTKRYELENRLTIKVESQSQGRSEVLAYTKDGILYLRAKGKDLIENIYKIDFNSRKADLVGRGLAQPATNSSTQNFSSSSSSQINVPVTDPVAAQVYSAKKFKKGTEGSIDGSYSSFIQSLSDGDLISGVCIPYALNSNSIYESMDKTHPRYGGYAGYSLDTNTSLKITKIISGANMPTNANIFYCDMNQNNKILNVLPVKDQANRSVFVALLDSSLNIVGKVNLKMSQSDWISSFDPNAFTKGQIFYLKLSGQLGGVNVKLFKVNFNNSSYDTLYQGK
ncbi:hypothetical protein HYU93_05120 [Candidatus Daviesbacteria bacterium]|nr:hypothetical protein [Candidatus Daviesbacteria bacterium]